MAATPIAQAPQYGVDLLYPSSFVFGQTPVQMQWVAVVAGATPRPLTQRFDYCDLGCGDGSTLCLLAASYPQASFVGIDMNPAHIALGRDLAARAQLDNVSFIEISFADLTRLDLPEFDFVTAYGVYSWLTDELQDSLGSFVQRKLRPGGLFGLHYSCLPGSAVRDVLGFYLRMLGTKAAASSAERFAAGLGAMQQLLPVARFFERNPQAKAILQSMATAPPAYVAHDVLHRQTHSLYCVEIHSRMEALRLDYLGSADVLPGYPELLLGRPAFAALQQLSGRSDRSFRELARDLMLDSEQRFDLFRNPDHTSPNAGEGLNGLDDLYLQTAGRHQDARRRWSADRAVDLNSPVYSAVLDAASVPAITLGDLLRSPAVRAFDRVGVAKAIEHLFAVGLLNTLVRRPIEAAYRSDRRYRLSCELNAIRLEATIASTSPEGFASLVLGSPVLMSPTARLQLCALLGSDLDRAWAARGGASRGTAQQFREKIAGSLPAFIRDDVPQLLRFGIIEEDR